MFLCDNLQGAVSGLRKLQSDEDQAIYGELTYLVA